MTLPRIGQLICTPYNGAEYKLLAVIGRGGFGVVYKASAIEAQHKLVAIKVIEKIKLKSNEKLREKINQEINIHRKLEHFAIVEYYDHFEDECNIYIILELCEQDLEHYRVSFPDKRICEEEAQKIIQQIVEGIYYLKTENLIHKDLKLSNILLDFDHRVKIADFGLAKQIKPPKNVLRSECQSMCGSMPTMSPEVISGGFQDFQCDIWALGCMLYTLLIGHAPFKPDGKESKAVLTKIVMGTYEKIPEFVSLDAKDLIEKCLMKNQNVRMKIEEVRKHNFLKSYNNSDNSLKIDSGVDLSSSQNRTRISNYIFDSADNQNMHIRNRNILVKEPLKPLNSDRMRFTSTNCRFKANSSNFTQSDDGNFKSKQEYDFDKGYVTTKSAFVNKSKLNKNSHNIFDRGKASCIRDIDYTDFSKCDLHTSSHSLASHACRTENTSCHYSSLDQPKGNSKEFNLVADNKCYNAKQKSFLIENPSIRSIGTMGSCLYQNNIKNELSNMIDTMDHKVKKATSSCGLSPKCSVYNKNEENATLPSNFKNKTLRQYCQPVNTRRIIAKRHKAKNSILHILDNGDVFIEDIKSLNGQELVQCSYRISSDGLWIAIYYPKDKMGDLIKENPLSELSDINADKLHGFENLPRIYYSKYVYAAKFVDMLKAHTAKVTYFSDLAKCILMENSPDPNFEAIFYSGESVSIGNVEIQIRDIDGKSLFNLKFKQKKNREEIEEQCRLALNEESKLLFNHAVTFRNYCLKLEYLHSELEGKEGNPNFPVVIGKRQLGKRLISSSLSKNPGLNSQKIALDKENIPIERGRAMGHSPSFQSKIKLTNGNLAHPARIRTNSYNSSCLRGLVELETECGKIYDNYSSIVMDFKDGSNIHMKKTTDQNFSYLYFDKNGDRQNMDKEKLNHFKNSFQKLNEKYFRLREVKSKSTFDS